MYVQIGEFTMFILIVYNLRHLSPDCVILLDKAKGMIEVNVLEDPHYHPADNRLG